MTHLGKQALEKLENAKFGEACEISNFEALHILSYVAELEEALSGKTMHDAHNVALERAAKVAEDAHGFMYDGRGNTIGTKAPSRDEIAAAIRALKT